MVYTAFVITVIIFVNCYSVRSDAQTAGVSLTEHVKKIDKILVDMQSQFQAQEKKYSTVISSLLSKLTQTTDEVGNLKTKLDEKDVEIAELQTNHNVTVLKLDEIQAKHNNVATELENTRSRLEHFENLYNSNGNIGFNGRLLNRENVTANTPIVFDEVLYESGSAYDRNTGKFLVPMNGTYQISVIMVYRHNGRNFLFHVRKDNEIIDRAYASNKDPHGSASTLTMTYLQQGESIWVTSSTNVYLYRDYCNFGIVLLNAHKKYPVSYLKISLKI